MAAESIPKWVAEEIQHVEFKETEEWSGSGYILDINKKDRKIDVQFYEKLPEGRYIATLDVPKSFDMEALEMGIVYVIKFNAFKGTLSQKAVSFLKEKYQVDMEKIFRFELASIEKLDPDATAPAKQSDSEDNDEE